MAGTRFLKSRLLLVPLFAGIVIPCLVFLALHFSHRPNSQSQLVLKDAVVISGLPLPRSDLRDLDGKGVSPELLRKGKVLLVFLTTDCKPCQQEMQLLSQVDSELSDTVTIYGIGVEDPSHLMNFIHAHEVKTKVLLDKDAKLMKSLSVKYFPTKFLLEDGVIVKTWFGNSRDQAGLFKELGL